MLGILIFHKKVYIFILFFHLIGMYYELRYNYFSYEATQLSNLAVRNL